MRVRIKKSAYIILQKLADAETGEFDRQVYISDLVREAISDYIRKRQNDLKKYNINL
tara:strand:- start:2988 stop:3158 length:171 start_codon:yes stop_codon:yes gene_type:complete